MFVGYSSLKTSPQEYVMLENFVPWTPTYAMLLNNDWVLKYSITDGHFVVDCALSDCEECIENIDNAVGECTKCTGTYVLDQGTCNDSKL